MRGESVRGGREKGEKRPRSERGRGGREEGEKRLK